MRGGPTQSWISTSTFTHTQSGAIGFKQRSGAIQSSRECYGLEEMGLGSRRIGLLCSFYSVTIKAPSIPPSPSFYLRFNSHQFSIETCFCCYPPAYLVRSCFPLLCLNPPSQLLSSQFFTSLCCPTSITTIANQSYQVCRQALQTRSIHDSILLPKVTAQSIESRRRKKRIMKGLELQGHAVNLKSKIIYRCYQTVSRRDRDRLDEVEWHELLSIFLV